MDILSSLWVRLVAGLLVLVAAFLATGSILKAYSERAEFKTQLAAEKERVDDYQRRVLEANNLAEKRAQSADRIRTVTKEVLHEVEVRIPADACPLPADWRVLHDAAAEGTGPTPAR